MEHILTTCIIIQNLNKHLLQFFKQKFEFIYFFGSNNCILFDFT
jgi:hypothetical protein